MNFKGRGVKSRNNKYLHSGRIVASTLTLTVNTNTMLLLLLLLLLLLMQMGRHPVAVVIYILHMHGLWRLITLDLVGEG
jgi:hypothetical protein